MFCFSPHYLKKSQNVSLEIKTILNTTNTVYKKEINENIPKITSLGVRQIEKTEVNGWVLPAYSSNNKLKLPKEVRKSSKMAAVLSPDATRQETCAAKNAAGA